MSDKKQCSQHPDFNPEKARFNQDNISCLTCQGLYYGAQPIGNFGGEFKAQNEHISQALVKILPQDLKNLGWIRFILTRESHLRDDLPPWYVDETSMAIYLKSLLPESVLEKIREFNCQIFPF